MGFFDKLKKAFSGSIKLDEDFFEAMEETLILGDLGVSVATDAVEQLRTAIKKEHLQTEEEVKDALRRILTEMLRVGDTALDLSTRPSVVMMIGVNGVGKTTTIGKLGYRLRSEGKKVLFCASDTFRAAAADQLEIWSQRAGVDIDPALFEDHRKVLGNLPVHPGQQPGRGLQDGHLAPEGAQHRAKLHPDHPAADQA